MKTLTEYINEGLFGGSSHKAPLIPFSALEQGDNVYVLLFRCTKGKTAVNDQSGTLNKLDISSTVKGIEWINNKSGNNNSYPMQPTAACATVYGDIDDPIVFYCNAGPDFMYVFTTSQDFYDEFVNLTQIKDAYKVREKIVQQLHLQPQLGWKNK